MAGVVPLKLAELDPTVNNALITALVLSKSTPSVFLGKEANEYRGVITYTLRDSKRHIVNCKFWGSKEKVEEYNRKLRIYDIIDVICPRIVAILLQPTMVPDTNQRFQPLATLPYTLVVNEGHGLLDKHNYSDMDSYRELRNLTRVSHKPLCSTLKLNDVRCSMTADHEKEQYADLLVLVVAQRPVKEIKSTRSGEMLRCLELVIVDSSYMDGVMLCIWQPDWIQRAQQHWEPANTALHLIEVKVTYSKFYKCTTIGFSGRSLAFENPIGEEVDALMVCAKAALAKQWDTFAGAVGNLPEADHIITQMTVKQLYARAEGHLKDDSDQFTAVLYAMVTKFDFDGYTQVTNRKCKSCHCLLARTQAVCDSPQCQLAFSLNYNGEKYDHFFNLNMHFSDHTGTLLETRLTGAVAERLLGLTAEHYESLTVQRRELIKWQFLMNYCEVKVLVRKVGAVRRNLNILIVDMKLMQLDELAAKISVF